MSHRPYSPLEIPTHAYSTFRKETSTSGHYRVPGTRFTFLPVNNRKLDRMYKIMVFRHWATGSARLCCQREGKQEVRLWTGPLLPEDRSRAAPGGGTSLVS